MEIRTGYTLETWTPSIHRGDRALTIAIHRLTIEAPALDRERIGATITRELDRAVKESPRLDYLADVLPYLGEDISIDGGDDPVLTDAGDSAAIADAVVRWLCERITARVGQAALDEIEERLDEEAYLEAQREFFGGYLPPDAFEPFVPPDLPPMPWASGLRGEMLRGLFLDDMPDYPWLRKPAEVSGPGPASAQDGQGEPAVPDCSLPAFQLRFIAGLLGNFAGNRAADGLDAVSGDPARQKVSAPEGAGKPVPEGASSASGSPLSLGGAFRLQLVAGMLEGSAGETATDATKTARSPEHAVEPRYESLTASAEEPALAGDRRRVPVPGGTMDVDRWADEDEETERLLREAGYTNRFDVLLDFLVEVVRRMDISPPEEDGEPILTEDEETARILEQLGYEGNVEVLAAALRQMDKQDAAAAVLFLKGLLDGAVEAGCEDIASILTLIGYLFAWMMYKFTGLSLFEKGHQAMEEILAALGMLADRVADDPTGEAQKLAKFILAAFKAAAALWDAGKYYESGKAYGRILWTGVSTLLVLYGAIKLVAKLARKVFTVKTAHAAEGKGPPIAATLEELENTAAEAAAKAAKGTGATAGVFNHLFNDFEYVKKHLVYVEKFSQKKGVSGGHNADEFKKAITVNHLIVVEDPPFVNGIKTIKYHVQALTKEGKLTGVEKGGEALKKTVFDPNIYSNEHMAQLGAIAAEKGLTKAITNNLTQFTESAGGINFRFYVDQATKRIRHFHPEE